MIEVYFSEQFLKKLDRLERDVKEEVYAKTEKFRHLSNHPMLKVHKLHGKMKDKYSFSVSYKIRITFKYITKNSVVFLTVGDNNIYND